MKYTKEKKVYILLLCLYTIFVLSETLLRKPYEGVHLKLELFWSYKVIKVQYKQMLGNIFLFIPFGLLLSNIEKRTWLVILIGFIFSCSIEILQFVLKLGLCEFDDIFHNTLGTFIGLLIYKEFITISGETYEGRKKY